MPMASHKKNFQLRIEIQLLCLTNSKSIRREIHCVDVEEDNENSAVTAILSAHQLTKDGITYVAVPSKTRYTCPSSTTYRIHAKARINTEAMTVI